MTSRQHRETRKTELVETHNIALSLSRIRNSPGFDGQRWKRALVHAIGMADVASKDEQRKIREAVELP